jgi:hypothetical protein
VPNGAPLQPDEAKARIREIVEDGEFRWSRHAREELAKDDLESSDALNVLRAGVVEPAEWENGQWRYRVRTSRMVVVIAFVESGLRIVTAWRIKR